MMPTQNPMGFMNPMNYGMFMKPGDQSMFMMNSKINFELKILKIKMKLLFNCFIFDFNYYSNFIKRNVRSEILHGYDVRHGRNDAWNDWYDA